VVIRTGTNRIGEMWHRPLPLESQVGWVHEGLIGIDRYLEARACCRSSHVGQEAMSGNPGPRMS